MLGLLTKSVALMAALQASLGMATPVNKDIAGVEKRDGGYVNAVYFTNWFVSDQLTCNVALVANSVKGYLWSQLPAR